MDDFAILRVVLENADGTGWNIAQQEDAITVVSQLEPNAAVEKNAEGRLTKVAVTVPVFGTVKDLRRAAVQRMVDNVLASVA